MLASHQNLTTHVMNVTTSLTTSFPYLSAYVHHLKLAKVDLPKHGHLSPSSRPALCTLRLIRFACGLPESEGKSLLKTLLCHVSFHNYNSKYTKLDRIVL